MAPSPWLKLPPELQAAIVEYISHPHDLRNLRCVCRAFGRVTNAQLYRETTIKLPIRRQKDHPLYHKGHFAHRHIRHLIFQVDPSKSAAAPDIDVPTNTVKKIGELLRFLPHDLLETIRTPFGYPLDAAIITLLATTQKALVNISLGKFHDSYLTLPAALKPWPKKLRRLEIREDINNENDLKSYRDMISKANTFQRLVIRCSQSLPLWKLFDSEGQDTGAVSPSGSTESHLSILRLVLDRQSLNNGNAFFTRRIEFCKLRTLDLFYCSGAAFLLRELGELYRAHGCAIRGFTLAVGNKDELNYTPFDSEVLLRFISCLSDLEYLTLDILRLTTPFHLKTINSHASTLKRLYINIGLGSVPPIAEDALYIIPLEEIRELCNRFTKLEQLAIALPDADLLDMRSGKNSEYPAYLQILSSLPKLEVFLSFTWPSVPKECIDMETVSFERPMIPFAQSFAADVFSPSPFPYRILSFGRTLRTVKIVRPPDTLAEVEPLCYLVEFKGDTMFPPRITRINPADARYYIPDCSAWHRPLM